MALAIDIETHGKFCAALAQWQHDNHQSRGKAPTVWWEIRRLTYAIGWFIKNVSANDPSRALPYEELRYLFALLFRPLDR